MRIVHLLHEFPFPPTSGIRCDMGRRLAAFHELGHAVFAVTWASVGAGEMPSAKRRAELDKLAEETALVAIGKDFSSRTRRLWNLTRYPSYIASRIPTRAERDALFRRIKHFRPDVIWLEGVHPSWIAWQLKEELGIPLLYRAHNIEHLYVAEQARLARSPRLKLALTAGTWGLEAAEKRLHRDADAVFDISTDDLAWWTEKGFSSGRWLATQPDPAIMATAGHNVAERDTDLLFIGSLSSPNNIAGLSWYLEEVHAAVVAAIPDVTITIAGRRPGAELIALADRHGASLLPDPPEAAPLFARSRVMLNPILHGSGVNIKTIDMLASGQPVVTTSKGARGLPREVVDELVVADGPEVFADQVIATIQKTRKSAGDIDRRKLIDRVFGVHAVADALAPFNAGQMR